MDEWQCLRELLIKAKHGPAALSEQELWELPSLYRRALSDLSLARTTGAAPHVEHELTQICNAAHGLIYRRTDRGGGPNRRRFLGRQPFAESIGLLDEVLEPLFRLAGRLLGRLHAKIAKLLVDRDVGVFVAGVGGGERVSVLAKIHEQVDDGFSIEGLPRRIDGQPGHEPSLFGEELLPGQRILVIFVLEGTDLHSLVPAKNFGIEFRQRVLSRGDGVTLRRNSRGFLAIPFVFVEHGAAIMLMEDRLAELGRLLSSLLSHPSRLAALVAGTRRLAKPEAATDIARRLRSAHG
jgi:hypothetical protein